jgi:N-methylhydantoinase A/oxoprolinase/acetone carboxylase beta subunit
MAYGAASLFDGQPALALDIGGTTTDFSWLPGKTPPLLAHGSISGFAVGEPLPELWSLGRGGGSIARVLSGSLLVGPESAGALPGPACFGLGGTAPTVTDACLVLGYFDPAHFLGGRRRLSPERALSALAKLGDDLEPWQQALGMKDRLEEDVAAAIRARVDSALLPGARLFALGGAGGLHAAAVAEKLGIKTVLAFPFSPAFGAFGASTLDVVHVYPAWPIPVAQGGWLVLGEWFEERVSRARRDVEDERFSPDQLVFELWLERPGAAAGRAPTLERLPVTADQRTIPLPDRGTAPTMAWLIAKIPLTHPADRGRLASERRGEARLAARAVRWKEAMVRTEVYRLEGLGPEARLDGPCLVESELTTLAVPPGWTFLLSPDGWSQLLR